MTVPATHGTAAQDKYVFIIHDLIPYCYDINSVLALPAGFRYRNRFDFPWVEPNLRGDVGVMVGSRVLITLRDHKRNLLVPVRWATIKLAERIGRIYYFEYILEELIQYAEDEAARNRQIADTTAKFGQFHSWLPGTAGQALGAQQPSVFRSGAGLDLPTTSDEQLSEWGNTIAAVTTSSTYEQVEFLKILGLLDLKGRPATVHNECFMVTPNTVYQLRVFQTIPAPDLSSPVTPHDIDVVTFSDHFVLLRPRQRAVGKYDMLNFVLKSRRLPPNERSAIEIPHVPHHHQQGAYAPSALYMPVVTVGRSPIAVALWLSATIISLILVFRPELMPGDETIWRSLATVSFVLLVSGWHTTANALFPSLPWGFNK